MMMRRRQFNQHLTPRTACTLFQILFNRIGVVMASVLVSSVIYRGFEHRSGKPKVYIFCSCDFMY